MKKLLLVLMCVFGVQSASYGFLGTALNTESEKAFLKSMEMHTGMTDEQAKELLLKAARLQERLHKWSAAGAGITAPFLGYFLVMCAYLVFLKLKDGGNSMFDCYSEMKALHVLFLGIAGWTFGKSLAASIRAKKRAACYKKMAQRSAQVKSYQRLTERLGFMGDGAGKSTWNVIVKGRKKVMKKGLNAQLVGTTLGALGFIASCVWFNNTMFGNVDHGARFEGMKRDQINRQLRRESQSIVGSFVAMALSVVFTLFSAYGLKGIVRKQAMKKLMVQMKNEFPGARAIAKDPEAAVLAKIAEWEREEVVAKVQSIV